VALKLTLKNLEVPVIGDLTEADARLALAAELFPEGKLTLKQAADSAQVTLWDLRYDLGKRKISYTTITRKELHEEVAEL
jgi:predicted HTH domain antitoxin